MNVILLADAAQNTQLRLVIEYVAYGAIIVVGILVLLLLRRLNRLPRHAELRERLVEFKKELEDFLAPSSAHTRGMKAAGKLLRHIDKLIYVTDRMAEKERDGEIASISALLARVRSELAAQRFGAHTAENLRATAAQQTLDEALELTDRVLARDARLNEERGKRA